MIQTGYDIIKAHGGEIKVETLPTGRQAKAGEGLPAGQAGTAFIFLLPA